MTDRFAAFATTAPVRWTRPPDAPYQDAEVRRLMARPTGPAPSTMPTADPASAEEAATLAAVAELLGQMGQVAHRLDRLAGHIARLELALADPALEDRYPADSDERDAGEERLRGLLARHGDAANFFASHAAQTDHLLDQVSYEAAVLEVRSWGGSAVLERARGSPSVMTRRWWRIAIGEASRAGQVGRCPF